MGRLNDGAAHVEYTTVNYRREGTALLYNEGCDVEEGKAEPSYFVGALVKIDEFTLDLSNSMAEEGGDEMEGNDFQDEPSPRRVETMV